MEKMEPLEDSDIKIAVLKKVRPDVGPLDEIRQVFVHHKTSGNLEKACMLGRKLAAAVLEEKQELTCLPAGQEYGGPLQRQLLFGFAVCAGLERLLPDEILSRAAQNAFFDALKEMSPQFYWYLNDSGVFSFYYLAYRRGGNVEHSIGKTFAMLNDMNEDDILAEVGEALYCDATNAVAMQIQTLGFSAIDNIV